MSGGLHGVGISVVNALSIEVEVEIDRDGKRHCMSFVDGGDIKDNLHVIGESDTPDDGSSAPAPPSASGPTRRCSTR